MSSHPDADAFVAAILRDPAEVTTRLVFADWLEETGDPSNVAWSCFIRLGVEADRDPPGSSERHERQRLADEIAPQLRARLALPAVKFVSQPEAFLRLLPAERFVLRIGNFRPGHTTTREVDEATARSIPVLPLDSSTGRLIVVHPAPVDCGTVRAVRAALSPFVLVVGGEWAEVVGAIHSAYAVAAERDAAFEQALADLPTAFEVAPGAYPVHDAREFVDDVLAAGERRGADVISLIPQAAVVRIFYRTPGGLVEPGRISRADWLLLVFPEIIRRGEATGCEFTVEVLRNGTERAIRIWPASFSQL